MMAKNLTAAIVAVALALGLCPAFAFADAPASSVQSGSLAPAGVNLTTQAYSTGRNINLSFTYGGYLSNGKGSGYRALCKTWGSGAPIVYKLRISGSKLYFTGVVKNWKTGKKYKLVKRPYKLTKNTKYYKHIGNGSYYSTLSMASAKKFMINQSTNASGYVNFNIKSGKVTALSLQ